MGQTRHTYPDAEGAEGSSHTKQTLRFLCPAGPSEPCLGLLSHINTLSNELQPDASVLNLTPDTGGGGQPQSGWRAEVVGRAGVLCVPAVEGP